MRDAPAFFGYIPQFKASNASNQNEVLSDLARMVRVLSITFALVTCAKKKLHQEIVSDRGCFLAF